MIINDTASEGVPEGKGCISVVKKGPSERAGELRTLG